MRREKSSKVAELVSNSPSGKIKKHAVNIYVSQALYREFKRACEKRNIPVSKVFEAFMQDFIQQHGN